MKRSVLMLLAAVTSVSFAGAALAWRVSQSPPNSYDLFCTYDLIYRLDATIEVDGRIYSSTVTHQRAHSRRWIAMMNQSGCIPTHGTALVFRLDDGRVFLGRVHLCRDATNKLGRISPQQIARFEEDFTRAMQQERDVDVMMHCRGIGYAKNGRPRPMDFDGFMIDNADNPTSFVGVHFDERPAALRSTVRLVSATAQAMIAHPADLFNALAPELLAAEFRGVGPSPGASMLTYWRRPKPRASRHTVFGVETVHGREILGRRCFEPCANKAGPRGC